MGGSRRHDAFQFVVHFYQTGSNQVAGHVPIHRRLNAIRLHKFLFCSWHYGYTSNTDDQLVRFAVSTSASTEDHLILFVGLDFTMKHIIRVVIFTPRDATKPGRFNDVKCAPDPDDNLHARCINMNWRKGYHGHLFKIANHLYKTRWVIFSQNYYFSHQYYSQHKNNDELERLFVGELTLISTMTTRTRRS